MAPIFLDYVASKNSLRPTAYTMGRLKKMFSNKTEEEKRDANFSLFIKETALDATTEISNCLESRGKMFWFLGKHKVPFLMLYVTLLSTEMLTFVIVVVLQMCVLQLFVERVLTTGKA